jgi:rhomboid protease GluP
MMDFKRKLKLFLVPFLYDVCGVAVFNLFIFWVIEIKLHFFSKEIWVYLPVILSVILSRTWLKGKLRHFVRIRKRVLLLLQVVLVAFYSVSMILLQEYLSVETGKLVSVRYISDAAFLPGSRYYKVQEYFIDTKGAGSFKFWQENARHKEQLEFSLYLALPIINRASDSVNLDCSYFLFNEYHGQKAIDLSKSNGNLELKQFEKEQLENLDRTDLSRFTYFEIAEPFFKMGYGEAAVLASKYIKYTDAVILKGHTTPFPERNKGKLKYVFMVFFGGFLFLFLIVLFIPLKPVRKADAEEFRDNRKLPGYSI